MPLGPVLAIANRAEIAVRIARTASRLGWQPVALLGEPDLGSYAAREIGRVECVGPAGSELDVARVVAAARRAGAVALHPGYGFLSERPELSQACIDAGMTFVGPSPETLALCGDKIATREAAIRASVPVLPASEPLSLEDEARWQAAAGAVGYPLIAKVVAGGGGRGLRVARRAEEVAAAIRSALREAGASAAGTRLYLERYLEWARHVEVQVAGNGADAVAIGDRDCSIQRRHQKVIEEAPAFGLTPESRKALHGYTVRMATAVALRGVATVEFLLSREGELFFIEINPRLQVEHTVTEEVADIDLVEVQLDLTRSKALPEPLEPRGHAIQARLYAEDPFHAFAPDPGEIRFAGWPDGPGLRVDAGYATGDTVPSQYDALLAKLIAWGRDRSAALERLAQALGDLELGGIAINRPWLLRIVRNTDFEAATHHLGTIDDISVDVAPPGHSVVAAIADVALGDGGESAWASAGPFRLVSSATLALHAVDLPDWQTAIRYVRDGDGWRADLNSDDAPQEPHGMTVVVREDDWDVAAPTGRWFVKLGSRPRSRGAGAALDGALRAPMPGTIVAVNVAVGQRVAKGDVLAVMTAMKIEMNLAAPFDGVVASVGCRAGDLVGSKQVLVTVARGAEG
jgi:acetyl/propionyl-CoA carboxylase alpha subunit